MTHTDKERERERGEGRDGGGGDEEGERPRGGRVSALTTQKNAIRAHLAMQTKGRMYTIN